MLPNLKMRNFTITEYLLNLSMQDYLMDDEQLLEVRPSFIRALQVNGFGVKIVSGKSEVKPKFQPERTQQTKEKVATLLTNLGFDPVQGSLDIAEDLYVKGEYAKSLWNGRKALEDLMRLLAERKGTKQKELLIVLVKSKSARELIEKLMIMHAKGMRPKYQNMKQFLDMA
jgi:hypothetical protein